MGDSIRAVADNEPVQVPLGDSRFEFTPTPEAERTLATKADIERLEGKIEKLEGKIDFMIEVFENLGTTFEGAITEFLDGPMGKLFGKLIGGKADGRSNTGT